MLDALDRRGIRATVFVVGWVAERHPDLIRAVEPLSFPWAAYDPFLFCVHHLDAYPPGNDALGPAADHGGPVPGVEECVEMHYGTCESYDEGHWCGAFAGVWVVDEHKVGVCVPAVPA